MRPLSVLRSTQIVLGWLTSACLILLCAGDSLVADDAADAAGNWVHWRGPFANGSAADSATPPVKWSDSENIAWVAELPGEGSSTPIVHGDRIFVLSAQETDRKAAQRPVAEETSKTVPPDVYYRFVVTCIDRTTGETVWQKTATEQVPHEGHHPSHTYCAGSPTMDGERLCASFGSRGIFCYSLDGELLWERDLGDMKTRYGWGEAVTPVIHGDSLIVTWDQETGSFITCLDAATGKDKWRTARPSEVTSWNTPLVTDFKGKTLIVANGTDRARCYDLADGSELWSCGGQTVNAIPSPIRYNDDAICISGYRGAFAVAIPLGSTGDVTDSDKLHWTYGQGTPYVPSAVLSGDRLFFTAGNNDILTVLDAGSGVPVVSQRRLSGLGNVYASPIAANGHIYFLGRDGTCVVLKDDDSLDVVSVNRLNDATDASPVAVDDQLFLRSHTKLYCVKAGGTAARPE